MAPFVDSLFWNQETQSSRSVDGELRTLPFEPPPPALLRSSRLVRSQQLLILQEFGSLPVTPSYMDGGFSLDSVVGSFGGLNWWASVTQRIQTHPLVSFVREKVEGRDSTSDTVGGLENAKKLFCKSMNALGVQLRAHIGSNTTLSLKSEVDDGLARLLSCNYLNGGYDTPCHTQASLSHKIGAHNFQLRAAFNDKCVDREGRYWNVPEILSLDLSSSSSSGIGYRAGICCTSGAATISEGEASASPLGALAGTFGRAAVFLEKELSIWTGRSRNQKSFNLLGGSSHLSLSGLIGGTLSAKSLGVEQRLDGFPLKVRDHEISADAFASVGLSAQLGCFQRHILDFSKIRAQLRARSYAAFVNAREDSEKHYLELPELEVTFHQQVYGPICARMDCRFVASDLKNKPQIQDVAYGIDWSPSSNLFLKVLAWYSPLRNEGMIEFRLQE